MGVGLGWAPCFLAMEMPAIYAREDDQEGGNKCHFIDTNVNFKYRDSKRVKPSRFDKTRTSAVGKEVSGQAAARA
jgi:hypothetical protein